MGKCNHFAYAIQAAVPNFEQIYWPSHDPHMTITWPSHDLHTVSHGITWPSHDPHMTLTWLMIDAVLLVLGMCSSWWWCLWSDVASLVSGSLWDLPLTKSVPHTDGRSAHRQQCRRYLRCLWCELINLATSLSTYLSIYHIAFLGAVSAYEQMQLDEIDPDHNTFFLAAIAYASVVRAILTWSNLAGLKMRLKYCSML